MRVEDIRKEIDANNREIQRVSAYHNFTLNSTVTKLLIRNDELQKKCTHSYSEEGWCKYCDTEDPNWEEEEEINE